MEKLSDHDFNRIILTHPVNCWPREIGKFCNRDLDRGYMTKSHFDYLVNMATSHYGKGDSDTIYSILIQLTYMLLYYNCIDWRWITEYIDINMFNNERQIAKVLSSHWHRKGVAEEWEAQ